VGHDGKRDGLGQEAGVGFEAEEGQDVFARVKSVTDTPRRTARTTARVSRPRVTADWGELMQVQFRPGNLSFRHRLTNCP